MNFNNGEIINTFFTLINKFLKVLSSNKDSDFQLIIKQFTNSYDDLVLITNHLKLIKANEANGAALEYLYMFSYVSVGYAWLKILNISIEKNKNKKSDFLNSKIATGKYYFSKVLPKTSFLKEHILSGASNYNDYKDDYFDSGFAL